MTTARAIKTAGSIRVQELPLHPMGEPVLVATKEITIIKGRGHEILQMPALVITRKQADLTTIQKTTHEQEHRYLHLPITHGAPSQAIKVVIPGEVFSGI